MQRVESYTQCAVNHARVLHWMQLDARASCYVAAARTLTVPVGSGGGPPEKPRSNELRIEKRKQIAILLRFTAMVFLLAILEA